MLSTFLPVWPLFTGRFVDRYDRLLVLHVSEWVNPRYMKGWSSLVKYSARPIVLFTDSLISIVFTSKFTEADTDSFTITKQTWQ